MYYWPEQIHPMTGIERQMKAKLVNINGAVTYMMPRSAPQTQLTPAPHLVNDGKANTVADQPGEINARRQAMLAYLRPAWA
jgi:hypothetical protein